MRRLVPALLVSLAAALVPAASGANEADIDACLTRADVDICDDTFSYLYGDTVILRGRVSPVHAEAVVLRKTPGEDTWERMGTVPISDTGKTKWRWRTRYRDAVQDAPYLLRFKIPGHGKSDAVEAYVLFGE
jgi:hypothetical protein